MWMLLAVLGAVAGASVMDLSARSAEQVPEDDDGSEPGADGERVLNAGLGTGGTGDLLTHAETTGQETEAETENGDTTRGGNGLSGLTYTVDPTDDPWLEGWTDDEFESTDEEMPEAEGRRLEAGNEGGQLYGGEGNDTLIGGDGDDLLDGGHGDNLLVGGAGDDTLIGGSGQSTLIGGHGDDRLYAGGGSAVMLGISGDNLLQGGEHDDTLIGGTGDDTLIGGHGDDLLVAGGGDNELNGGWGDDTLVGARLDEHGRDIGGANTLNGGAGDDLLILGQGDLAHGGEGADTFVLGEWIAGGAPAQIVDFTPGEDRLVLTHAEGQSAPDVAVQHDAASGLTAILVNGAAVALLNDPEAALSAADVDLVPHEVGEAGVPTMQAVISALG